MSISHIIGLLRDGRDREFVEDAVLLDPAAADRGAAWALNEDVEALHVERLPYGGDCLSRLAAA